MTGVRIDGALEGVATNVMLIEPSPYCGNTGTWEVSK